MKKPDDCKEQIRSKLARNQGVHCQQARVLAEYAADAVKGNCRTGNNALIGWWHKLRLMASIWQACGANALAVAIPCHRLVRNNGDISGYRWGVDRKRALLARERRAV
jgi:hypothetical protein